MLYPLSYGTSFRTLSQPKGRADTKRHHRHGLGDEAVTGDTYSTYAHAVRHRSAEAANRRHWAQCVHDPMRPNLKLSAYDFLMALRVVGSSTT
jgi:hypothetical protein